MNFWILVCEALKLVGLLIAAGAFALGLWETMKDARR